MRKKMYLFVSIVMAIFVATGCSASTKKAIDLGKVEGGKYTNEFFGLSMDAPADWYTLSKEEIATLTQAGQQMLDVSDAQAKLAEQKTLNFYYTYKYDPSALPADVIYNPVVMCIGENLGVSGLAVKDGTAYLKAMKEAVAPTYESIGGTFTDIVTTKLGGKDFAELSVEMPVGDGTSVTQKYAAIVVDNYALLFSYAYHGDDQKADVDNIMKSVAFK